MAKTTSDLLTNIKRRTQLPDDGGTLSDSDILAFASDELENVVVPRLMALNEWYYTFEYSQALSSGRSYRINPRCAFQKIISVEYLDGSNYRFIAQRHPLQQANRETGESFAIYGNNIVVSDAVPSSGTLRIRAFLRPSRLVSSGCSAIVAANPGTNAITVDVDNFSDNDSVDIIYKTSPYEVLAIGASIASGGATTTYVLTGVTVSTDWENATRLTPAEQTDRIPLPDELHDYLAQRVAIRCMEARGFKDDMENHLRKLKDLEAAFDRATSPRARGEFKAISDDEWSWTGWRA